MAGPTHALVLAAGLGTRLRPLTDVRAKPAVPVAGEPIARRITRWLVASGVVNLTFNLHHLPQTLTAVLGDGSDLGACVRYSWEQPQLLGSAGGPRQAIDIVGADPILLINGDTMTDASIAEVWAGHEGSGALVTLALVPNTAPHRYGGVRLADDGAVLGFDRRGAQAEGSFHFIGVQVATSLAFSRLAPATPAHSIGGLYETLIAERPGAIRGARVSAKFWDIGTVMDYWSTSAEFSPDGSPIGSHVYVAPSAQVTRSIIWDHVSIGEHALLDECIVTDGVRVPEGSVHTRAILTRGADGRIVSTPFPSGAV